MDGANTKDTIITGRIIRGIAGFYYVDTADYGVVECHARGILRKDKTKPLVGDTVILEILPDEDAKGHIVSVNDRINSLYRPEVANVDQVVIVFAMEKPAPNLMLLDKFLIMPNANDIPCHIVFNKKDLVSTERINELKDAYSAFGGKVIPISAKDESDVDNIKHLLEGKVTVLAGPSGVGKSTLINAVVGKQLMETGEISQKLMRGKHTTRRSELFKISGDTYIMDTPGFTSFELTEDVTKDNLSSYYTEFFEYEGKCRFLPCSHTHEPGCAVKSAVNENCISQIRYDNYNKIYEELKNRRVYR